MAIPKNAKRVFKGVIFDVYQWQQKMFDGTLETFEKIKRQDTVVIIATTDDQKVIIQKQKQPDTKWFLTTPSGRMDKPGETPKAAALRELLEETGMEPRKMFLWKKVKPNSKIEHTVYFFIAQGCKTTGKQNLDSGEKIKLMRYSFEQFLKLGKNQDYRAIGPDTQVDLLMATYDKQFRAKFKKLLFG